MSQEGSLATVPYLMGSVHTFSAGYGYGARVPTVRNQPTLPAAVPKYRHAPISERGDVMFKSTRLDVSGGKAVQRHRDQMALQTSGEYGSFMFKSARPESTMATSARPATTAFESRSNSRRTATPSSGYDRSRASLDKSATGGSSSSSTSASSSTRLFSPINTSGVRCDSGTISRYRKKDPLNDCFAKYTKYDALAAKSPPRNLGPTSKYTALGNTTAAEFSRTWQLGLRPNKRAATSHGGAAADGE